MIPKKRIPTHPGEILLHEFLIPMKICQSDLSKKLHIPVQRDNNALSGGVVIKPSALTQYYPVACRRDNTIINGKRGISVETALLFAREFKTTPEFWMNLQNTYDLFFAEQRLKDAA